MSETHTIRDPFIGKDVEISSRLVDRLRGKYACGPTMPNGEPEFGWRQHDTAPIQHQAAAEIERLRAALAPFAGDKLPSSRRTEIAYDRHGLRHAMSPLQIAQTAAYLALSATECHMGRYNIVKLATDYLANNAAENGADELIRELLKSAAALQEIPKTIAEMASEVDRDTAIPRQDLQWKKGYKQACSDIIMALGTASLIEIQGEVVTDENGNWIEVRPSPALPTCDKCNGTGEVTHPEGGPQYECSDCSGFHRKQWFKHGDDDFVMRPPRNFAGPRDVGLLPTPMGCITVRPGDWIITDASGRKTIETDPAILKDLKALALSATNSGGGDAGTR